MLTSTLSAPKLMYRDFVKFPEDGKRHELIDGVHYVSPSPVTVHQRILGDLYFAMREHLVRDPQGEVFFAPFDVVFSLFDIVVPDLLFISAARTKILGEKNVQGAPDLVVEIASRGTRRRDEGIKRDLYDRGGVREYWTIEPAGATIRVYRCGGALEFVRELTNDAGDALTSPLLPGMSIPLARVFGTA